MVCLGNMCMDTLHKGDDDDDDNNNNKYYYYYLVFSIPEIHQRGYRPCQ